MSMQMNVIWSNEYDVIENLEKEIRENPDDFVAGYTKDDDFWAIACQLNDDYLDDERANLNIDVGEEIIIIADLGLWDGRHQGYKLLHKTNIADCLTGTCGDYVTWFVDDRGDLMCRDIHHDGTNLYTYRAWKPGISHAQRSYFMQKVAIGKATRKDITRYTQRIGDRIANVYGWKVRK